ncbi:MAG: TIR domain-containing protein [Candidatus Thiodiazotropha sp.]
MGGSLGGGFSSGDLDKLTASAKQKLKDAAGDGKRHVFISFSHEDMDEVNLLRGQAKNPNSNLEFDDHSVKEPFDSENADYIRRKIREKIERASVTAVYLTEKSASSRWVNWEIQESIRQGKGVIGVHKGDAPPANLPSALNENGCKVVKWSHDAVSNAIEEASKQR